MSSEAHTNAGAARGREVEWQLASADLGPVRRWLADHSEVDGLTLEPGPAVQILDTYFDTDDWRIHRAGYAFRIRNESGKWEATLKSLQSASAHVADRRELNEELESSETDSLRQSSGPVGQRVLAVSGAHALLPLFEVRTSRQKFAVRESDKELGEIALDETVISRPKGGPCTTLQRVEVEALTEAHKPLQSLVKTLRRDCALEAAGDSKFSQGLKSAGLAPAPPAALTPTAVSSAMRIDEAAFANLRQYLSAWFRHEPGARLGDDPEELHDLRVAGRRLEAVLRQFHAFLPEPLLQLRPMLKKVLRVLGDARDLDVALCELDTFGDQLPEGERAALEPLKQHLLQQRTKARARMLELLDSEAIQKDFQKLTELLAQPSTDSLEPSVALATSVAPNLIRARYRKLRKSADRLTKHSSMDAYHAVRGRVKKLRYTLETVAVIYGKPADEMLRALRRWQEKLGVQHDADVANRRLQALAANPPRETSPETLFLMGRLAQHHTTTATQALDGLAKAYRKVRERWKKMRTQLPASPRASRPEPLPIPAADPGAA